MKALLPLLLALLLLLAGAGAALADETDLSDSPQGEARDVHVALFLADMVAVNGAEQAFSADVYMLSLWKDPALVGKYEDVVSEELDDVWHPTLLLSNLRSAASLLPEEVVVRPDGTVSHLQRYSGRFTDRMDLREFPMDKQVFSIRVVAATRSGANVRLHHYDKVGALRAPELSISDWEVGEASFKIEQHALAPGMAKSPSAVLSVPAQRRVTYYVIQVLMPLFAIVLMAYAVFWIDPAVVATRVGVVVTTMLTLIAYRFMLSNHVPRLAYLTRLDWFIIGATLLVLLTLFTMAGTSLLVSKERHKVIAQVDRYGRVLYPIGFALYSAIVWFL